MDQEVQFCSCSNSSSISTKLNAFGWWHICNDCGLPIEDSFEYHNPFEDSSEP